MLTAPGGAGCARAQEPPAPTQPPAETSPTTQAPDSTRTQPPVPEPSQTQPLPATPPPSQAASPSPPRVSTKVKSTFKRTGEEIDRFELGFGAVQGFFDVNGTFAYRRFLNERGGLERFFMGEVSGTEKSQLAEGVTSAYFLLRPSRTDRQDWRLRPLLEFGPGAHLVIQAASIDGFSRTNYHAKVYVKTHAYAGFEAILTDRFGFLVRGRFSTPSHHPFDYAQAAIFLR
jgi:hypothetical protein